MHDVLVVAIAGPRDIGLAVRERETDGVQARDEGTVIAVLKEELADFRDARGWAAFHEPEELAKAISIEAGELLELFLWGGTPDIESIEDELADVIIYCLNMANACDIDVTDAIRRKVRKNAEKYPADKTLVP